MTQRKPVVPTTSPTPARTAATDDSSTFSLAVLAEAELRAMVAPCDHHPANSGVVDLEGLRGLRTRPTHRLVVPEDARRVSRPQRSWVQAGVLAMGMMTSAAVGLFAVTMNGTPATVAVEQKASRAATLSLHHAEPTFAAAEAVLRSEHRATAAQTLARFEVEPPTADEEAEVQPQEAPARATPAPNRTRARATPARTPSRSTPATTSPAQPSTPSLSADCILDPSRCGPERLTSAQVRTGLQQVVPAAQLCAAAHGASTGTRVPVRLSIEGTTGRVTRATPQEPHQNALGRCVANELAKASFPSFTQSSMGVLYTVTL